MGGQPAGVSFILGRDGIISSVQLDLLSQGSTRLLRSSQRVVGEGDEVVEAFVIFSSCTDLWGLCLAHCC